MRTRPLVRLGALCAFALLGGCFATKTSQAPIATTYPLSEQQRMQAAWHWEILARDQAQRILENPRLRLLPLYVAGPEDGGEGNGFHRGYRALLTSELVAGGARVSTVAEQAAEVRFGVQTVRHRGRGFVRPPQGAFTALAAGIAVATLPYNHWSEPALALIPGAVLADLFSGSWTYTGNDEVIITTQVIENQRILYSASNLYYINRADREHYARPVGASAAAGAASPSLLPIIPVTDRW